MSKARVWDGFIKSLISQFNFFFPFPFVKCTLQAARLPLFKVIFTAGERPQQKRGRGKKERKKGAVAKKGPPHQK